MSRLGLAVVALLATASLPCCTSGPPPEHASALTIATGGVEGVYHPLGVAFAGFYNARRSNARVSVVPTGASAFNVDAVHQGVLDVAFTQADIAYTAFTAGTRADPTPHTNLRGIAVLYVNEVHILTRTDGPIRSVRDLRGRRVGVGAIGSGTQVAAEIILRSYGLNKSDVEMLPASFMEVTQQLRRGELDAGFMVSSYPVPAIASMNDGGGIRLLSLEEEAIRDIRSHYPFFRPVVIPRRSYRHQDDDVVTVGVDNLLVCRVGLPEELVFDVASAFFDALPELGKAHPAAKLIDPEQGPTTPIPLHPGAARYYRARELSH